MSEPLDTLEKRWKSACRILFREEVGDLSDYSQWLSGMIEPNLHKKSSLSGKDVAYAIREYGKNSKWMSFDEIDWEKKYAMPDLKLAEDIESLASSLQDRFYYTGNVVLGNSEFVKNSSSINDSFYMDECAIAGDSKYSSRCIVGRLFEDCFGSYGLGETQFCMRCTQTFREKRCFEVWMSQNCSDSYYCYNIDNCSNCIFCFNLKNKEYCVGNREVGKEMYEKVKKKLLGEIVARLKKEKRLPSLLDIVKKSRSEKPSEVKFEEEKEKKMDKGIVEREFGSVCRVLFGKELSEIDSYAKWLMRHVHGMEECKSAINGRRIMMIPYAIAIEKIPKERIVSEREAQAIGENVRMREEEVEGLCLGNAYESIGKLAFLNVDFRTGENPNVGECAMYLHSADCYRASAMVYAKRCAYSFWPRSTSSSFGSDTLFDSMFCVNCYNSVNLSRCFEMDECRTCSDCFFCHNCENVQNGIFCFNVKNMQYAVGNVEMGRKKFLEVKKKLQEYILKELEGKKDLKMDIYSLGGGNKHD